MPLEVGLVDPPLTHNCIQQAFLSFPFERAPPLPLAS
jgi:hypothetical protein